MIFRRKIGALLVMAVTAACGPVYAQTLLTSEFNYQGALNLLGAPVNDTADFEFTLWDASAGGNQLGAMFPINNVDVENGLFTVLLDFGTGPFIGYARWLEIAVRSPAGAGTFTTLSPRQELTPTPFSLATRGISVDSAGNVGIGTTNPQTRLDVDVLVTGQADAEGLFSEARHESGTGTSNLKGVYGKARTNSWTGSCNLYGVYAEGLSDSSWGSPTNNIFGVYAKGLSDNSGGFPTNNIYGVYGIASGNTSGSQTAIGGYFTASGADTNYAAIFDAGNVGIGLTDPSTKLEVNGTVTATEFHGDGSGLSGLPNSVGIASITPGTTVSLNSSNMVDIATVTIDAPADGHVIVQGTCEVQLMNTTSYNYAHVQIDKTAGGSTQPDRFLTVGLSAYASVGGCFFNTSAVRVYPVTAGRHTYRLEGMKSSSSTGNATATNPTVTAVYYPTN